MQDNTGSLRQGKGQSTESNRPSKYLPALFTFELWPLLWVEHVVFCKPALFMLCNESISLDADTETCHQTSIHPNVKEQSWISIVCWAVYRWQNYQSMSAALQKINKSIQIWNYLPEILKNHYMYGANFTWVYGSQKLAEIVFCN